MSKGIVLVGANGQLGRTISCLWQGSGLSRSFTLHSLDRAQLDILSSADITEKLDALRPAIIINAAAYTQVDQAESERAAAFAVNELGASGLAQWASDNDAWLIHVSTDFVFDGAASRPYLTSDETNPLGVYAESKLAGEKTVLQKLPRRSLIIRTSWLYSQFGKNFLKTMLSLMSERDELSIVSDQIGSPTSTHSLAGLIFAAISNIIEEDEPAAGIFHWSDGASISWFDFAEEIQRQASELGILNRQTKLKPISTKEYPTPAKRPAYSVLDRRKALDSFQCSKPNWQNELALVLKQLETD